MKRNKNQDSIKSVSRAINVITAISQNINRVSDIAAEVNLSHSTVHRLLQSLVESGMVMQDTLHHKYYFGNLIAKLVSDPFTTHQHLIRISRKRMEYLRSKTRETVALYIRFGLERIRLEELMGPQDITYIGRRDVISSIYPGATGKVLLSQIPQDELQGVLEKLQLVKMTPNTITNKKVLMREVEKARRQGYATSQGESSIGVAGISVPIFNYINAVSLSIAGPEERFAPKMMDYLDALKEKANEISLELLQSDVRGRSKATGKDNPTVHKLKT